MDTKDHEEMMADETHGGWMFWNTQRPPNERGTYRWKIDFKHLGITLTPEWTEELDLCGMGYASSEWWPASSKWDGYRRTLPAGLMWRHLSDDEASAIAAVKTRWERENHYKDTIIWGGLELLPSPHTGRPPIVSYVGRYSGAPPYHPEKFHIKSWMVSQFWENPSQMAEAWNKRDFAIAREVIELRAQVAKLTAENDGLQRIRSVGMKFHSACTSAWAAGEPQHKVLAMIDAADEFADALAGSDPLVAPWNIRDDH